MTEYIINFSVYTLAIIGLIFTAFIMVQKTLNGDVLARKNNNFLSMESVLSLEPRKNLYVINAGNEKFLLSTDMNGCKLLTKLENSNNKDDVDNNINFEHKEDDSENTEQFSINNVKKLLKIR